jgi:hypothetical protein
VGSLISRQADAYNAALLLRTGSRLKIRQVLRSAS